MKNRRSWLLSLVVGLVAGIVVTGTVLADELMGRIIKVNADAKELTVKEKDTDKEIKVTVNDETVFINRKGEESKFDLEKFSKGLEKAKNGIPVVITHEKGVASKIKSAAKKKNAPANP
jgi:hypothetical protein